jgi:hypothetical protein
LFNRTAVGSPIPYFENETNPFRFFSCLPARRSTETIPSRESENGSKIRPPPRENRSHDTLIAGACEKLAFCLVFQQFDKFFRSGS